ncbi:hypothetical protein F0562_029469 [Nyssa sinensis]|uniref:Uncharacterized protein n=1 Tax=Nyssa sinensis TaxID=561372 RepID=A0A5J5B751_9ASTE|nr:hypothetical protein F0562_029469 [Nyssa sinensis]
MAEELLPLECVCLVVFVQMSNSAFSIFDAIARDLVVQHFHVPGGRTSTASTPPALYSPFSTQRTQNTPNYSNRRISELFVGSTYEETATARKITPKTSNTAKTPRLTPTKASATPKRRVELSKNRELFLVS